MCFFPQGTSERWKNSQRCFQVEEVDFLDFLENHVAIFRIMTSPCDLTLGPVKSWKTIPVSFKLAHAAAFNALADCVAWWYRERSQPMSTVDHKSWGVGAMKFIQLMNRYNHPTYATKKPKKIIERVWFLYHSYMCSSYWTWCLQQAPLRLSGLPAWWQC